MAKNDNLFDFIEDVARGICTAEGDSYPFTINPQDFRSRIEALKKVSGTKTITSSGTHDVANYEKASVAAGALTASGSASANFSVNPGTVTISAPTQAVSGKTQITLTPTTVTTGIGTYYVALKASAAAGSGTGSISGTATAKASTAGYLAQNSSATSSISGTATASVNKKDSSIYYAPIASGAYTVSGGDLSGAGDITPTITVSTGSDTNMGNITIGAKDTTNYPYYFKVSATNSTSSKTITRAAVTATTTAGYISGTTTASTKISSSSATVNVKQGSGSQYVGLKAGAYTLSGGGLTGGGDLTPTVSLASGSDTNMSNITIGAKDTTNYPYYFKVNATSTSGSKTITRAAVTATQSAGYLTGTTTAINKISSGTATVNVKQGSGNTYVNIKTGGCTVSGGGLSKGDGSVSVTGTNIGLTAATTKPASGYYITASGYGAVSRADIKDTHTAGYIPAKSAATVIAATSATSNTATKYYTITTEEKSGTNAITPSSSTQTITPSSNKLLSKVVVNPIPSNYKDTSSGDAQSYDIRVGRKAWVDGDEVEGTLQEGPGEIPVLLNIPRIIDEGLIGRGVDDDTQQNLYYTLPVDFMEAINPHGSNDVYAGEMITDAINLKVYIDHLGTATPLDVKKGETFACRDGFLVEGSMDASTASLSGGGLSGGKTVTPTVAISTGSDTNMSGVSIGTKNTSGYYFKVTATSSTSSNAITRAAVTSSISNGYVDSSTTRPTIAQSSATINVASGSNSTYVNIPSASVELLPITVSSAGVITAKVDMEDSIAGYFKTDTSKDISVTKTLTAKAGGTIKPSATATQTWAKGTFLTSTLTVAKEANLVASNIKNGVTICGVAGNYEGSGGSEAGQKLTLTTNGSMTDNPTITITYTNAVGMHATTTLTNNKTLVIYILPSYSVSVAVGSHGGQFSVGTKNMSYEGTNNYGDIYEPSDGTSPCELSFYYAS